MPFVLIEKPRPHVTLVTLNRPERMNSMAFDVMIPLRDALEEVSIDNDARVVVLTGAGHGFCLAVAADIRIASEAAYFRAAGINNGLTSTELGISYLLPRAIGSSRAFEIMLSRRVSRRALLRAGGASAAIGALGVPWRHLDDDPPRNRRRKEKEDDDAASSDDPRINLSNIQGNVLAGFNKDHQRLLFFRIGDGARARQWLASIVEETSTTARPHDGSGRSPRPECTVCCFWRAMIRASWIGSRGHTRSGCRRTAWRWCSTTPALCVRTNPVTS